MNPEKLALLQQQVRIGGKGSARRKVKKVHKQPVDDKKLQATLKKMNAQRIPGIEEVNMFKEDGQVLHFKYPKVSAVGQSNTFCIVGTSQTKSIMDLSPGILSQLGAESLQSIKQLAESSNFKEYLENAPELVDFEKVSKQ